MAVFVSTYKEGVERVLEGDDDNKAETDNERKFWSLH